MAYEEKFFIEAINQAKRAYKLDEVPVGAVIVKDGNIIAKAYNQKEHKNLATAHAEILAINKACKVIGDFRLLDCEMYVSLEPCVMCAGAIISSRIKNVYYGAPIQSGSICVKELANKTELNHKTNFEGGFHEDECATLLTNYFKNKRSKKI